MKVFIYNRVSGVSQAAADKSSLDIQLAECKDYCLKNDYEVVGVYVDTASGSNFEGRENFNNMLAEISSGVEAIVVWKLDRFSRNICQASNLYSSLQKMGVSLISVNEKIDNSISGKLLLNLLFSISSFELDTIKSRLSFGKAEAVKKGIRVYGRYPFGYNSNGIVENEAGIIRQIFKLKVSGKNNNEIASMLNDKGLSMKGKPFTRLNVMRILKNEVYVGKMVVKGEVVNSSMPSIVSKYYFDNANK